ncbi:ABC transporter permease [Rhodoplanes sp. TEM]|uniref:ABC transporter permease n=1 Tax=Rhodoplanes tepidamans TaxID=200616 RepID=A0ABT5JEY9_RHOTP|nr:MULTISPECIES: ABC transporter permease [Rhodoplanes]MDC7788244.1 ABC transporter permease [Rhodoplanes tepidamans]MDC7982951.1 ABC transporter permease [Rhodoplanes sp. TEM]MDQ0355888.1 putative spermidine/putrescine transport system permease protein [Rhodoplanes tepidamans]
MTATELPAPSPVVSPAPDRERWLAIGFAGPATLVLVVLFALPLALLFTASVAGPAGLTLSEYEKLATPHYLGVIWNSLRLALLTTGIAFLIGYPASFALARARGVLRSVMLAALFLPLAASVIVKAFAWTILLRSDGLVNTVLIALGIVDEPIRMIFTETALIVGAVNIFLPFMILPIYAVVAQLDHRLVEAAATLGASPVVAFVRVVMPLTLPGIIAGVALVFSLSVSAYVVPTLLIGERYPTLSTTIAKAFLLARQPGFGAAAGVVLLAITLTAVALSARLGRSGGSR